jgi:putative spermidine/putrescine transport system substrate-binding protein
MINRRSFLQGVATLALARGLNGCATGESALKVFLLEGSIPPRLLKDFRDTIEKEIIQFKSETNLKNLLKLLENWQNKPTDTSPTSVPIPFIQPSRRSIGDLVTLGDTWLTAAIAGGLIEPLDPAEFSRWPELPPRWREIVTRDNRGLVDGTGQVWGAPYRWGTAAIAYNEEKFKRFNWRPRDWSDLWRPELKGRIALVDDPREVIGLTLKKSGHSYNTLDIDRIPELKPELLALQKQVRFYSSNYYLQSLLVGDVWLAVGWSDDILPLTERGQKIEMVIPSSGTSFWSDAWVKPAKTAKNSLADKWIDFCWGTEAADRVSLFTDGLSPMVVQQDGAKLPPDIQKNPLLSDRSALDKSEFIYPLPAEVQKKYDRLWEETRRSL